MKTLIFINMRYHLHGHTCIRILLSLSFVTSRGKNQDAVNMAKDHIVRYFIVVGITEDMHGFFELLDYHIPNLFRGIANFYEHCK